MWSIPNNFKLLFTPQQIAKQVARLGVEVSPWAKSVREQTNQDLLCLPILRGGIFFFADLVREIHESIDMAAVKSQAYEVGQNAIKTEQLAFSSETLNFKGRTILLVDDICDSGQTLAILSKEFLKKGALAVKSAVLIRRVITNQIFQPDFIGFDYTGPEWFVGYGMDDRDRWRNLNAIYVINS